MAAFVISRTKQDSKSEAVIDVSYWNDQDGCWESERKQATRFSWSWAFEVIKNNYLKESNPGDLIQVDAAPDADMDNQ